MIWAIFSDVHSNLPALDAVLSAIDRIRPDRVLCLGDLVGYGPHPRQVLDRVRELGCPVVAGNHDLAAIGRLDTSCFNVFARQAVKWTSAELREEDRVFLAGLPLTWEDGPIAAVHGTRDDPAEFYYLQTVEHAAALLAEQPTFLGVFGHTHVPLAFVLRSNAVTLTFASEIDLSSAEKALVNVGSVGQPRDEDARAAFVTFNDTAKEVAIHRVAYDIDAVARDILESGLPQILADRLRFGV